VRARVCGKLDTGGTGHTQTRTRESGQHGTDTRQDGHGNYPVGFLHSGARDFDLGGGFQHSGNYPMGFLHSARGHTSRGHTGHKDHTSHREPHNQTNLHRHNAPAPHDRATTGSAADSTLYTQPGSPPGADRSPRQTLKRPPRLRTRDPAASRCQSASPRLPGTQRRSAK
jgi:hypothetical protein